MADSLTTPSKLKSRVNRSSWMRSLEMVEVQQGSTLFSYWELPDFPTIEAQDDDLAHIVTSTDRIDALAFRYYKESRLWWVIGLANGWDDCWSSLNEGDEIVIPSPRYVRDTLVR